MRITDWSGEVNGMRDFGMLIYQPYWQRSITEDGGERFSLIRPPAIITRNLMELFSLKYLIFNNLYFRGGQRE